MAETDTTNFVDGIVNFFANNEGKLKRQQRESWSRSISPTTQLARHYQISNQLSPPVENELHFHRSTHQNMVHVELTRTTAHHPRHLSVLLPLCRSTLHEESKTVPAEKHINRLQHLAGCFQRHSRN